MKGLKAFTLLETLIVIAILGVVSIALTSMVSYLYKTDRSVLNSLSAPEGREQLAMTVLRELRGATYGPSGEWPLAVATDSTIAFYLDTDSGTTLRDYTLPEGVLFHYFDALGAELPSPADVQSVARVNITASPTSLGSATLRNIPTR